MSRSVFIFCVAALALASASEQPRGCGHAMQPPPEEVFVYDFVASHAPVAPRAVLATGAASGAAVWAACRSEAHRDAAAGAPTTLALALVSATPKERFSTNTSLLFVRATLVPRRRTSNRLRNATTPVAGEGAGALVRSARLRTLEAHHHARFDWVVLDEATAGAFSAFGGALNDLCADGSPRVVVARYDSPPSDAHRAAISGGNAMKHQPWVEIRVHPRFLVYSCL